VYIQPEYVDAGAIASLNDSGILPPDMILIPPGLLPAPEGLLPLEPRPGLRRPLARSGAWRGEFFAVPVAMGGYMWAWNDRLIDSLPDDWRESDAPLAVPTPERWRRWDAALLSLLAGKPSGPEASAPVPDATAPWDSLDLGLDAPAITTPAPSPAGEPSLPRHLPEGFRFDDEAWRGFINGEVAAMPVTQREIRRLQALSDQGKGPDWRLAPGDGVFSDQLLNLALVDRQGADEQRALSLEFLSCLLSDESQGNLSAASAFSVTEVASGYGPGDPLTALDDLLHSDALCVPRCFDGRWGESAESIVRELIEDSADSPSLWRRLRGLLAENTND